MLGGNKQGHEAGPSITASVSPAPSCSSPDTAQSWCLRGGTSPARSYALPMNGRFWAFGTCCVLVWSACHQSCPLHSHLGGPPHTLRPRRLSCSPPPAVLKMRSVTSAALPSMRVLFSGHPVLAPRHADLGLPPTQEHGNELQGIPVLEWEIMCKIKERAL